MDPFSSGRTLGNTLNALFVAHDDADYLLAEGGAATFETSLRVAGSTSSLGARVERETSVAAQAEVGGERRPRRRRRLPAEPADGRRHLRRRVGAPGAHRAHPLEPHGRRAGRRRPRDRPAVRRYSGRTWARRPAPRSGSRRASRRARRCSRSRFRLGGPGDRARIRLRHAHAARRSGPRSSTSRRSAAGFGRWRSWMPARRRAPTDLFSSTVLAGAGVGVSLLRRRAAVRPEPPAHPGYRRQGALRHRRPGAAMKGRRRVAWPLLAALGPACGDRRTSAADRTAAHGAVDRRRHGRNSRATGRRPSGATRSICSRSARWRAIPESGSRCIRADTIEAGEYPVRAPDVADTTRRPSAAIGLRWFSQTSVMGFQGDSGGVTLERRADGSLSGRFTAGAHRTHRQGPTARDGVVRWSRGPRLRPRECAGRGRRHHPPGHR